MDFEPNPEGLLAINDLEIFLDVADINAVNILINKSDLISDYQTNDLGYCKHSSIIEYIDNKNWLYFTYNKIFYMNGQIINEKKVSSIYIDRPDINSFQFGEDADVLIDRITKALLRRRHEVT